MGKREPNPPKYSESDMEEAVQNVRSKTVSLRKAAKKLGIAPNSLRKRVDGIVPVKTGEERRGRHTVIPPKDESELADHLRTMAKWGFGLSRKEVMLIVSQYCTQNNIKTPFKDSVPGKDWFVGFQKRHNLELKNPETLEKNRLKNTADPFLVYEFYDLLENTVKELGIEATSLADHLYNLDEVGVSHDPSKTKMVAGADQKGLHRTIQGSGKENTTVMGTVCANGELLPPLFIFKAAKLWSSWRGDEDIPGTFYAVALNGFITTAIFYEYFIKFSTLVKIRPVILVVDGHVSHLDINVIIKAKEENITILKLPSHTTDLLQPLDRACFAPFKTVYDRSLMTWQRENQRTLTKCEFVNLVCSVWREGISALNIISGFKACGIAPVDRNKYPVSRLNPEKLQRYLELKGNRITEELTNNPTPSTSGSLPTVNISAATGENPVVLSDSVINPTTCTDNQFEAHTASSPNLGNPQVIEVTAAEVQEVTVVASPKKTNFEDLLLKKISATKPKTTERRMIHSNAAVITSEDYLAKINERNQTKQKRAAISTEKGKTSKKRRKTAATDAEKENEPPNSSAVQKKAPSRKNGKKKQSIKPVTQRNAEDNLATGAQVESLHTITENQDNTSTESANIQEDNEDNFTENDYVLISYNNSTVVVYIQCVLPGLDEAIVLGLKQVSAQPLTFENDETLTISATAVIKKLKEPTLYLRQGAIQYEFDSL